MKKYFMVHNPAAKFMPRKQHDTSSSAVTEAKRLASENVGTMFIVLEAVDAYMVEKPEPSRISLEE